MVCWRGPVIRGKPCVISAVPKYEEKQEEARQKLWTRENCNFFFPKERFMWAVPGLYLWPKRPRRSCTFTLWKSEWLSVSLQDRGWSPGIFSLPWTTLLCHPSWITLLGHSSWVTPPGHPSWATPPGLPLLDHLSCVTPLGTSFLKSTRQTKWVLITLRDFKVSEKKRCVFKGTIHEDHEFIAYSAPHMLPTWKVISSNLVIFSLRQMLGKQLYES